MGVQHVVGIPTNYKLLNFAPEFKMAATKPEVVIAHAECDL